MAWWKSSQADYTNVEHKVTQDASMVNKPARRKAIRGCFERNQGMSHNPISKPKNASISNLVTRVAAHATSATILRAMKKDALSRYNHQLGA